MGEVIVIGGHHHNTLGVIRGLGRKGIKSLVIITNSSRNPCIQRSRYIAEIVQLNSSEDVVPYLLLRFRANSVVKPVLIACHDRISEILDANRAELSKLFYVPGTPDCRLGSLINKMEMTSLAESIGLNVPFSFIFDQDLDLGKFPYPVITKPLASKEGSKRDIKVCRSAEELISFMQVRKERKFQIQEFIDKIFEFQLIGCSVDGGSEIVIPGVSKLIRTGSGSNTGFLEYTGLTPDLDDTLALTKKFIRATGYSGLFSVEFLRGCDGKDYFMEMNFRNDGNAICSTNSGANLPFFWMQKCLKNIIETPRIDHTEYVMPEYNELAMWISGAITTNELIRDLKLATSYMEYAPDDPSPTHGHWDFRCKLIYSALKRPIYKLFRLFGLK